LGSPGNHNTHKLTLGYSVNRIEGVQAARDFFLKFFRTHDPEQYAFELLLK